MAQEKADQSAEPSDQNHHRRITQPRKSSAITVGSSPRPALTYVPRSQSGWLDGIAMARDTVDQDDSNKSATYPDLLLPSQFVPASLPGPRTKATATSAPARSSVSALHHFPQRGTHQVAPTFGLTSAESSFRSNPLEIPVHLDASDPHISTFKDESKEDIYNPRTRAMRQFRNKEYRDDPQPPSISSPLTSTHGKPPIVDLSTKSIDADNDWNQGLGDLSVPPQGTQYVVPKNGIPIPLHWLFKSPPQEVRPVPTDINEMAHIIKNMQVGRDGFPSRTALQTHFGLRGVIDNDTGRLIPGSRLWRYFGDERVLKWRTWVWLVDGAA